MSSKEQILALVNANNPQLHSPLTLETVDVSLPAVDTDNILTSDTIVTIVPKTGSGYDGHVTVHYHRNSMGAITSPTTLVSENLFTPELVISMLNDKRGTQLDISEVTPITIPPMETGTTATITITALSGSYGWTGSTQVDLVYGIPPNSADFNTTMNQTLPGSGV